MCNAIFGVSVFDVFSFFSTVTHDWLCMAEREDCFFFFKKIENSGTIRQSSDITKDCSFSNGEKTITMLRIKTETGLSCDKNRSNSFSIILVFSWLERHYTIQK